MNYLCYLQHLQLVGILCNKYYTFVIFVVLFTVEAYLPESGNDPVQNMNYYCMCLLGVKTLMLNEGQLSHSSFILWGWMWKYDTENMIWNEGRGGIIKVLHRLMTAEIRFWDQPAAFVRNTTLSQKLFQEAGLILQNLAHLSDVNAPFLVKRLSTLFSECAASYRTNHPFSHLQCYCMCRNDSYSYHVYHRYNDYRVFVFVLVDLHLAPGKRGDTGVYERWEQHSAVNNPVCESAQRSKHCKLVFSCT